MTRPRLSDPFFVGESKPKNFALRSIIAKQEAIAFARALSSVAADVALLNVDARSLSRRSSSNLKTSSAGSLVISLIAADTVLYADQSGYPNRYAAASSFLASSASFFQP